MRDLEHAAISYKRLIEMIDNTPVALIDDDYIKTRLYISKCSIISVENYYNRKINIV